MPISQTPAPISPTLTPISSTLALISSTLAPISQTLAVISLMLASISLTPSRAIAPAQTAFANAMGAYRNFRSVALAVIHALAIRTALAAEGPIPQDKQAFVSVARAGYTAVSSEPPFAAALAAHGYPAEVVQGANALLETLSAALSSADTARATAEHATLARNKSLAALSAWVIRFERVAAVAARAETDSARRIA